MASAAAMAKRKLLIAQADRQQGQRKVGAAPGSTAAGRQPLSSGLSSGPAAVEALFAPVPAAANDEARALVGRTFGLAAGLDDAQRRFDGAWADAVESFVGATVSDLEDIPREALLHRLLHSQRPPLPP
jgi:hypothetical protein